MRAPRGAHSGTAALLAATDRVHRHVRSEETNDVGQVMATVSQEVCYMLPDVTGASLELVVLTDRAAVQDYYADERNFMEIVSSTVLVGLTTDWYTFHESVSTTREVATGGQYQNDVAILFPVADDGIVGEILAARRPWHEVYAGLPDPQDALGAGEVAARRRQAQGAHQAFLEALAGGADAARSFEPTARFAVRIRPCRATPMLRPAPRRSRGAASWWAGPSRIASCTCSTGWWVIGTSLPSGRCGVMPARAWMG